MHQSDCTHHHSQPPEEATFPPCVLVVDADAGHRQRVSDALARAGYTVAEAGDGAAALFRVEKRAPAAILLDLPMPVMDGWTFMQAYHRLPGPHAPVLVFEPAGKPYRRGAALLAAGRLPKPCPERLLLAAVARLIPAAALAGQVA